LAERLQKARSRLQEPDVFAKPPDELASDFPERVRLAREGRGWTRKDLALRLNEKLSLIEKLEKGTFHPDEKLRKKVERELGIKLTEPVEAVVLGEKKGDSKMTVGDYLRGPKS